MPEITIEELEKQYSTNEHRKELLDQFKDELGEWRDYLAEVRIWLFGSYLTDKEQPEDIDILLAGRLKTGTSFPPKLPRKHKDRIHVISNLGTGMLSTKNDLIQKFNSNQNNVVKNIKLSADEVVDLLP